MIELLFKSGVILSLLWYVRLKGARLDRRIKAHADRLQADFEKVDRLLKEGR